MGQPEGFEPGASLQPDIAERLKKLGFDPGWPVYGHSSEDEPIELGQVKAALFESSYLEPVVVPFEAKTPGVGLPDEVPMLLELAKLVWVPETVSESEVPLKCHNYPDWYLRGVLYKNSLLPDGTAVPMHAYLEMGTPVDMDGIYLQFVPRPSDLSADAPLKWGERPPGGPVT
jgi:hypothetical protein